MKIILVNVVHLTLLFTFAISYCQVSFSERLIIDDTAVDHPVSVFSVDLDNDGDMDVLSASRHDNKVAWYENTDAQGTFSSQKVITTSAQDVWGLYVADLDNDGDQDVLSASADDNTIAWYKNLLTETGVNTKGINYIKQYSLKQNYPNPFNMSTTISFSVAQRGHVCLKIYDINGREIQTLVNAIHSKGEYIYDFDAKDLPSGLYLYEIQVNRFNDLRKMLLVK